jgi:hypothetical protein
MDLKPSDSAAKHRARSNPLLASARLVLFFAGTITILTLFLLARLFGRRDPAVQYEICTRWTRRWAAYVSRLIGFRLRQRGAPPPPGSVITPNHIGYCDVLAMGATTPVFFITTTEIRQWPFIGTLIRSSSHPAVTRRRTRDLSSVTAEVEGACATGIRFAYSLRDLDGRRLRAAIPRGAASGSRGGARARGSAAIRWRAARPGVEIAEDVAYWKDHQFVSHFVRLFGLGGIEAEVTFDAPISPDGKRTQGPNRQGAQPSGGPERIARRHCGGSRPDFRLNRGGDGGAEGASGGAAENN